MHLRQDKITKVIPRYYSWTFSLCNVLSLYVPILATSLVFPRDIKFSEAWQLSGSDDEDKDTNRRVWKGIRQGVTLEKLQTVLIRR